MRIYTKKMLQAIDGCWLGKCINEFQMPNAVVMFEGFLTTKNVFDRIVYNS